MLIRCIKLRNIRSYVEETVCFQEGSTLLSGDIGSGKSTILLALEFAVFGIIKGYLSGGLLLRHGCSSGSVELEFDISSKKVLIKRVLRRSINGIMQDSGILVVDGAEFKGSPQELKSRVLNLLGYPDDLINKSKSLIFRHTVLTAQDELRQILYEDKEGRVETLRRLFGIDKYRRVRENASALARLLKEQCSFIEGKVEALPGKLKELDSYSLVLSGLNEDIQDLEKSRVIASNIFELANKEFLQVEAELERIIISEKELAVINSRMQLASSQAEGLSKELDRLKVEISAGLAGLEGLDPSQEEVLGEKLFAKNKELAIVAEKLSEVLNKRTQYQVKRSNSESVIEQIAKLDTCPLCQQKVDSAHVEDVKARQHQVISSCTSNLEKLEEFEKNFLERQKVIKQEIDNYSLGRQDFLLKKVKLEALSEKKQRRQRLEFEEANIRKSLNLMEVKFRDLSSECQNALAKKKVLSLKRKEAEEKRLILFKTEQETAKVNAEKDTIAKFVNALSKEIKALQSQEAVLKNLKLLKDFVSVEFNSLADLLEKIVMGRVHTEFNAYFQEWFKTLVEDESVNARLDESFTPLIEQNGFETSVENLSGGEKSSIALSYRLALNKVINDFLTSVKTRDLLILDEPTEGFSSEQLDRVRAVLHQAKVKQTIIVSHEAKMEGFVDRLLRVQKVNHVSKILQ